MKKLGLICCLALFGALLMTSCGGAGTAAQDKSIEDKLENGGELTTEDYSRMINYVGEFARKAQTYAESTNPQAAEELAQLRDEYPYLMMFRDCIENTPVDKLTDSNLAEVAKYAGLIEFSTPIGYDISTNPEAAGIEVAVPDTTNGVVAGAVDTIKVKK